MGRRSQQAGASEQADQAGHRGFRQQISARRQLHLRLQANGRGYYPKKIEKPAITPIPANREYESAFVKEIKNAQVHEIQPQFLDFKKDLTVGKTSRKLPLVYKQNTQDDLFNLVFRYEFGDEDDIRYSYAAQYLDYIGTDKKSVSAIKQAFYKLACNFSIAQGSKTLQISLNGLNENLPAALQLTEEILHHAKADKTSWNQFIDLIEKQQQDAKTNQMSNFSYLWDYSTYGAYNPTRNAIKTADLRKMDPRGAGQPSGRTEQHGAHRGLLWSLQREAAEQPASQGAQDSQEACCRSRGQGVQDGRNQAERDLYRSLRCQEHLSALLPEHRKEERCEGRCPDFSLFNEYYGGGMNTIVFQELRETRGLAYNAGAAYYTPVRKDEKDYFMRHIITQNDKMMDCIHVFDEITDNLPQNEASFNLAKQNR